MVDAPATPVWPRTRLVWIAGAVFAIKFTTAVWHLFRYSYAWDPASLQGKSASSLDGRYLAVEGVVRDTTAHLVMMGYHTYDIVFDGGGRLVCLSQEVLDTESPSPQVLKGRLVFFQPGGGPPPVLYVADPRFTRGTVIALVVEGIAAIAFGALFLKWALAHPLS